MDTPRLPEMEPEDPAEQIADLVERLARGGGHHQAAFEHGLAEACGHQLQPALPGDDPLGRK
jgi:hypothetical protein